MYKTVAIRRIIRFLSLLTYIDSYTPSIERYATSKA